MGVGFWVIQAVFVVAAIATAIYAERERHTSPTSSSRHVPIQPGMDFTIQEQARLLRLRQRIREARAGSGRLNDDLVPDASSGRPPVLSPSSSSSTSEPVGSSSVPHHGSAAAFVLALGVLLLFASAIGIWRTTVAMDGLEPQGAASFVNRYIPGPLANPGKYFAAVNSASARGVDLASAALLDQKRTMDRWEATLTVGLAVVLATIAQRSQRGADSSQIGFDLVAVCLLAALLCGGLSWFELA